jgi:hypothetical protein
MCTNASIQAGFGTVRIELIESLVRQWPHQSPLGMMAGKVEGLGHRPAEWVRWSKVMGCAS